MLHQSLGPPTDSGWLRVAHTSVKRYHRLGHIRGNVKNGKMGFVLLAPTMDDEIVASSLYKMVFQSHYCWVYIMRGPTIDGAVSKIVDRRVPRHWVPLHSIRLIGHVSGSFAR